MTTDTKQADVERAREIVASSMHDRDKSWDDLVLAGERDDCSEMRMVLTALALTIPSDDQWVIEAEAINEVEALIRRHHLKSARMQAEIITAALSSRQAVPQEVYRQALEKIAQNDSDGLAMYTPQAMQAIARAALTGKDAAP